MTDPNPPASGEPVPPPPDPIMPYQPPASPYQPEQAHQPSTPYAPDPWGVQASPDQAGPSAASPYQPDPAYQPGAPGPSADGFAIASLVLSCVSVIGLCTWGIGALLGVLGAIFGHIARRRIRVSGAGGDSMALAGIIVGWIIAGLGLLFLTFIIVMIATDNSTY